jgi:DNA invertase Pin-like site-specific DNA recombinase
MSDTKRRAIAILRVSTDQQDVERQRRDVDCAARVHNLQITRTLELEDLSGTKMLTNAEVRRVLSDLSRTDTDGVCISAIDRLIRPGELGDLQIFDAFQRTKKKIWTPGQEIDLTTQAGFLTSGIMGVIAGFERQMILARTSAGKEISRQRGGNPCGSAVLPRGVSYSKSSGWVYVEPDVARMAKAYDLLFERRSWPDIAERIGDGWTSNGIRLALRNPIWKGVRRYSLGREQPLEVKVIDKPLISPERWQAAQQIILEKRSRWAKTKRPPHVLLSGMLLCACGKPCYVRCGGRGQRRSYYYCSTGFPGHGPKCGARSVQQEAADQAVERIISTQLLDAAFLRTAIARFRSKQPARDQNVAKLVRQREKLEVERQRLLRMTLKGTCTEADYDRENKRIESEMRDLDLLAPAALPASFDAAKLVVRITRTFARFAKQSFEEKRGLLRAAVREIVLDDGMIPALTLNGAFLECVNSEPRSRSPYSLRCRVPATERRPARIPRYVAGLAQRSASLAKP